MKQVGLGWCWADSPCPHGVEKAGVGPLAVLSVRQTQAQTPRHCMQHQLRCFEFGMNLLPVAPRSPIGDKEMIDAAVTRSSQVIEKLRKLSGFGQLTLELCHTKSTTTHPTRAKTWLRDRQAQRVRSEEAAGEAEQAIRHLIKDHNLPMHVSHDPNRGAVICHLLMKRADEAQIRTRILSRSKTLSATLQRLRITGLWPPYAFSQLPEQQNQVVA